MLFAAVLALAAAPARDDKVELREVPDPTPGRDEVLVNVQAVSLNRGEWHRLLTASDGWRPGWDIAGTVARPAASREGPPMGSRVVGLLPGGGWAQQVAVPVDDLAVLPDTVSFAAAATLPVAGMTALLTLRQGGHLLGKAVLVVGAGGGVGRFAVQLAARSGAQVVAEVGGMERAGGLLELGAADIAVGLEGRTGRDFDLILESAGGESLARALKQVRPGGLVVSFGNSSRSNTTFSVNDFYPKGGARLYGFFLFQEIRAERAGRHLAFLAAEVAAGRLRPQIGLEASWRQAGQALATLADRRLPGKAVLQLD